jgi:hypothetical protein
MTAYEALTAIESRKAADAKLAEMRVTGVDRRTWNTYEPKEQLALAEAGVRPVDPTREQRAAEFADMGKQVWTSLELAAVSGAVGKGGPVPALFKELWGRGVAEAIAAEVAAARAEGRVIEDPSRDRFRNAYDPSPAEANQLRVKMGKAIADAAERAPGGVDAGLLRHAQRFLTAVESGQPVHPAALAALAKSSNADDRLKFIVAAQKLGPLAAEAPGVADALKAMSAGDPSPVVHSRAYAAFGKLSGLLPPEPPAAAPSEPSNGAPAVPGL